MQNMDIRNEVAQAGIRLWQVAEELGINDGNFSRKLRRELNDEQKARIRQIIKSIKDTKEVN